MIIRKVVPSDASKLLQLKLAYLKKTNTIPLFLEEYPAELKLEEQLIKRFHSEENSVLFVAEKDGKLIGNIDLMGNQRKKLFHTGMIGMGILSDQRNNGIGRLLLETTISWAKENRFIQLIWLEVYATNKAAVHLYKKLGFEESGRVKNFFLEDNQYIDKITMVLHI